MKNRVITFLIFLVLVAFLVPNIYAQLRTDSNKVRTRVGNPQSASDIVSWAQQITNALEIGFDGSLNRMMAVISNGPYATPTSPGTDISNIYWCTYLVIDSYNLAGIVGLNRAGHAAVVYIMGFWRQTSGYKFLDYFGGPHESILPQVQPGFAIFFQKVPGASRIGELDHTAIVKSININSHGDGILETYDSNVSGGRSVLSYPVDAWNIKGAISPAVGFGTVQ